MTPSPASSTRRILVAANIKHQEVAKLLPQLKIELQKRSAEMTLLCEEYDPELLPKDTDLIAVLGGAVHIAARDVAEADLRIHRKAGVEHRLDLVEQLLFVLAQVDLRRVGAELLDQARNTLDLLGSRVGHPPGHVDVDHRPLCRAGDGPREHEHLLDLVVGGA